MGIWEREEHMSAEDNRQTAIKFVTGVGFDAITKHESALLDYATASVLELPGLRILGTAHHKASVLSFLIDGIHPHDIGTILDREGIAIRTGHHCAQPVMERFGVAAPRLELLSDDVSGQRRTLRVRARSSRGAPWLFVFLESPARVLETAVDGVPMLGEAVAGPLPRGTRWGFRHVGLAESGVEWSLTVEASAEPLKIVVVDQSSGIPEGEGFTRRLPPGATFARSWVSGTTLARSAFQF